MNSSLVVALNLTTIMATVLVLVTPMKALLEMAIPASNRGHDAMVQLLALVVGVVISLFIIWAEGPLTRSSEVQLIIAVLLGIGGGSGAIGAHSVATTTTARLTPPAHPPSGSSEPPEHT